VGDFAADVRVNLVEDKQRHCILRGQSGLDREHQTGNFAARGDRAHRLERLARVG
jgi:hypothetical protein